MLTSVTKGKRHLPFIIALYFIIMSILTFYFLYRGHVIYRGADVQFHINRIEELYQNLRHGNMFPMISTYSANQVGIATNVYYPALFLYMFALLRFLPVSPITAIYLGLMVINLVTFLIAYYTFKDFSGSRKKAFIFANLYFFSTYRFLDILNRFDISEFIALTFIPLVFWAFYKILFKNEFDKWIWLAAGMGALLYSHILTALIVTITMGLLMVFNVNSLSNFPSVIKAYLKAVVLFLGLSSAFIYSFLVNYLHTPVKMPKEFLFSNTAMQLGTFVNNSISNNITGNASTFNMGIVALLILIIGAFRFNTFSKLYKKIYVVSVVTTLLSTNLFPWSLLQNTPVSLLQFPFRVFVVATFFIALLGVELVNELRIKHVALLLVAILYIFNISSTQNFINTRKDFPTLQHAFAPNASLKERYNIKVDRKTYFKLIKVNPNRDYVPINKKQSSNKNYQNGLKIYDHYLMRDGRWTNKKVDFTSIPNGMIFKLNGESGHVSLPFYLYNKTNYKVYVDGKRAKWDTSQMKTLTVNLHHNSRVKVLYSLNEMQKLSIAISFASVMFLVFGIGICFRNRQKTY